MKYLDEDEVAGLPDLVLPVSNDLNSAGRARTLELVNKLTEGRKERHSAALEDMEQDVSNSGKVAIVFLPVFRFKSYLNRRSFPCYFSNWPQRLFKSIRINWEYEHLKLLTAKYPDNAYTINWFCGFRCGYLNFSENQKIFREIMTEINISIL